MSPIFRTPCQPNQLSSFATSFPDLNTTLKYHNLTGKYNVILFPRWGYCVHKHLWLGFVRRCQHVDRLSDSDIEHDHFPAGEVNLAGYRLIVFLANMQIDDLIFLPGSEVKGGRFEISPRDLVLDGLAQVDPIPFFGGTFPVG